MTHTYRISAGYDIALPSILLKAQRCGLDWEDGDPYEVVCMYVGCLRDPIHMGKGSKLPHPRTK
jgi:hypothetical protein